MRGLPQDGFSAARNRVICQVLRATRSNAYLEPFLPRTMYDESRGTFMVTSTVPETNRQVPTLRDLTRRVQAEYPKCQDSASRCHKPSDCWASIAKRVWS